MTEGLITRIGRWIDHRWESKATESMVEERWQDIEDARAKDELQMRDLIVGLSAKLDADMIAVEARLADLKSPSQEKDVTDLKNRMEKIELYCGMTRKVDPTKPAVAKSAFQM